MSRETERPRKALIIDTETTGLDPSTHACVEVACALYDLERAAPLAFFSSLIQGDRNEAEAVNGISVDMLRDAPLAERVWPFVDRMAARADVIVAHRADFDRSFVPDRLRDVRPWACSKFRMPWSKAKPGDRLVHLALAYNVPVISAHRAMADVDTLVRVFARAARDGEDVQWLIESALRPCKRFVAVVSFDDREKAKSAGFAWDSVKREWWRDMPPEDATKLPFTTREIPQ